MRRKLALISATVALGALLVVGGTMAYFTGTAQKTNTITTYGGGSGLNHDIKVEEDLPENPEGYTAESDGDKGIKYGNVKPGAEIFKNPTVKYEGNIDAYIRYKVVVTGTGVKYADLTFKKDGVTVDPMNPDDQDVYHVSEDGYVYVKASQKGGYSNLLFDHVTFSGALGNDFTGAIIQVVADAVQAENFVPDYTKAAPWGDVEIDGTVVTEPSSAAPAAE